MLQSKAVTTAGYDAATQRLQLEFSNGRVYEYFDVPRSVFDWLIRVSDKGAYVSRMLTPRYRYQEVSPSAAPGDLETVLAESLRVLRASRDGRS